MRILQVTPYFAPAWAYGGPPRVMYDYACGLVRRGHDVTVFTTDVLDADRRARPRFELIDGVAVHRSRNLSNSLAWRTKKYLPPGLVARLARRVTEFDVVHVTDARTVLTAAAYAATRVAAVPLCISAHGSLPGSAGLRGQVKAAYDRVFVRPMLRSAALLLAQTDHEAQLYIEGGADPGRVRMLPLPLERSPDELPAESSSFRRRIGAAADERLLLFVGRIHHLKGLDFLIEAVEPLLRSREATLAVVGRDDGAWGEIAARFAGLLDSGAIRFVGPVYGEDRFAAYAAADVFCLTPRHWEETSLAALEAAACGTPVVVTEQADIPNLVSRGAGFVVPFEAGAVRDAVREALARARELGANARALMRDQHAKERVVERLDGYLVEAVSRTASP